MGRQISSPEQLKQATEKLWTDVTGQTKGDIKKEVIKEFSESEIPAYAAGRQAPQITPEQMPNILAPKGVSVNALPSFTPAAAGTIAAPSDANVQQGLEMLRKTAQQSPMEAQSQAQNFLRAAYERSAKQANALAASRGYNPAAVRGAQYQLADANQAAALQAAQIGTEQQMQAQQAFLQGSLAQSAAAQNMAIKQAELEQQVNIYNNTAEGQRALAQAELDLKASLANQGVDLDVLKTNAARGDTRAIANIDAIMRMRGMDDGMVLGYLTSITNMNMAELSGQIQREQISEQARIQREASRNQLWGNILQGGATVLGGMLGGAPGAMTGNKVGGAVNSNIQSGNNPS